MRGTDWKRERERESKAVEEERRFNGFRNLLFVKCRSMCGIYPKY